MQSDTDRRVRELKRDLRDAALAWSMRDMRKPQHYEMFFQMLLGESDYRYLISACLAVKLASKSSHMDGMHDLIMFFQHALQDQGRYDHYMNEAYDLLTDLFPEDAQIKKAFELYSRLDGRGYGDLDELDEFLDNLN